MKMKIVKITPDLLKGLQKIELEMLLEVDRICRKNGINYSLDGGTLLGAARHKGFIPWDEDADIMFLRHEYEKFKKACRKELDSKRFFLQDYTTDKNYRWGYAKLRRKGTHFVRSGQEQESYMDGVFMDIFVLDNIPDNHMMRQLNRFALFLVRKTMYSSVGRYENNRVKSTVYKMLYKIPRKDIFKARNTIARHWNQNDTKLVHHYTWPYPGKNCLYGVPSGYFKHYVDIEFEGSKLMAIRGYDSYLKRVYGDYMTPPPPEKQVNHMEFSRIELL